MKLSQTHIPEIGDLVLTNRDKYREDDDQKGEEIGKIYGSFQHPTRRGGYFEERSDEKHCQNCEHVADIQIAEEDTVSYSICELKWMPESANVGR